jgi:hypothetical protein
VNRGDVGDHTYLRLGDSGQAGDFPARGHGQLKHGYFMVGFERQKSQGQAILVVEVSRGLVHRQAFSQQGGDHLFRGGLASTAGYGDEASTPNPAHRLAKLLERLGSVENADQGWYKRSGRLLEESLFNHGPRNTTFKGLPDKLVPIEPWPPDGEK